MAHPDLNEILNTLLPFAEQTLASHGEFFPFAATMDAAGKIAQVGADTGDERPKSQDVINLLVARLREQAKNGAIRAAGICLDVRTLPPGQPEKTDAVCARLEHSNGEAVEVYQPYRRTGSGALEIGELFAARGQHAIFRGPAGTA